MPCRPPPPAGPGRTRTRTLRVIMLMGKFQGVMAPTTPTACFSTTMRRSRPPGSSTSPHVRLASSANHSTEAALQLGGAAVGGLGPGLFDC